MDRPQPPPPISVARFRPQRGGPSRDVLVRLTDRGVVIERADGDAGAELIWPYGALAVAEPLSQHSIDALLSYAYQPGAALFVPDKAFARALQEKAPHLTARSQRLRAARPWLGAAALIGIVAAGVWLAGLSPARAIARMLPDSAREMLGDQVLASMTGSRATCTAPGGLAALDELTAKLSKAAGSGQRFKVVVVDWDVINAFAAPGERIVLTRELIEKAASADEVAGVLAHEMGHGIERHPETGIVRGIGLAAATELLFGQAGGGLAHVGLLLTQMSYSREAEREADRHALAILRSAQISPRGLLGFFDRVANMEENEAGGEIGILRSHPQTAERRAAVASVAPYAAEPALDAASWRRLQSICTVTTRAEPEPSPRPPPPDAGPRRGETNI